MTDQTTLDGLHATEGKDWIHTRSTGREIVFSHQFGASTNIDEAYFTMRNSSDTAVIQLTLESHAAHFDFTTDNEGQILLDDPGTNDSVTSGLAVGDYDYGVMLIGSDGIKQVPIKGTITLTDEEVRDDATAAYLSWQTRSTIDSVYNALLLCNAGTTLASDASSGAGTITVTSASQFSAGDTIHIRDTTNSESHDIAAGGISGTTITLDGTTLANSYTALVTVAVKEF